MFRAFGRTEATILRRSDYKVCIESPDASGGCRWSSTRDRRFPMNPSPFPCGREPSRDLHTIDVRDSAGRFSGP